MGEGRHYCFCCLKKCRPPPPKSEHLPMPMALYKLDPTCMQATTVSIATVLQQEPYQLFYQLDRG